jgi:hypothetical protein
MNSYNFFENTLSREAKFLRFIRCEYCINYLSMKIISNGKTTKFISGRGYSFLIKFISI